MGDRTFSSIFSYNSGSQGMGRDPNMGREGSKNVSRQGDSNLSKRNLFLFIF